MNTCLSAPTPKAQYIFRYYLPVEPMADAETTERRFIELLDYCKRNHVDAVMFFVSLHTDWNYMPDTLEHGRLHAKLMAPYARRLKEAGISYQLNFQNLMGSIAGGCDFKSEFGWETLTDHTGHSTTGAACPLDKTFREIMGEQLRLWAETEPEIIWIDDDFRMHNHGGLLGNGKPGAGRYQDWFCYCDEHLKQFSEKVGHTYTREELLKEAFAPGQPSEVRRQWLDFLDETMAEAAAWVYDCVHAVSPNTRLAQMTSVPDVHSAEGRNWDHFLRGLCGDEFAAIIRPHFGPYSESTPYELVNCYLLVDQLRTNIEAQYGTAEYGPEIENTRYTAWSKSVNATRFQLWLSMLMGCPDVTLAIVDLEGSPLDEEPEYGDLLRDEKANLDALAQLQLKDWQRSGVVLISDPENAVKVSLEVQSDTPDAIAGKDRTFDTLLTQMGIPVRFMTPEDALKQDDLIVVDSYTVHAFSDEQLKVLLGKKVLLDGSAAHTLLKKGYGQQIGVLSARTSEYMTSSEIFHTLRYADGNTRRMPCRLSAQRWKELELTADAQRITSVVACIGDRFPGVVKVDNRLGGTVWTYACFGEVERGFFNHTRTAFLRSIVNEACADTPTVGVNRSALTLCREKEDALILAAAPLSPDGIQTLPVHLGKKWQGAACEIFRNGRFEKLADVPANCELTVDFPCNQYQWAVLRFRRADC